MSQDATQMCCPSCGGTLEFDPELGKLRCTVCHSAFTQEECAAPIAEQETSGGAQGMKAFSCSGCGAEILTDGSTGAARCPYCGSTDVTEEPFSGAFRPDLVIPFAFTKQQAMEQYKAFYGKKFLLPKAFSENKKLEEIQGIYVPCRLLDGAVTVDAEFEGTDKRETDTEVIRDIYCCERRGSAAFSNVPADASGRIPDDIMDSLEPFRFDELKPFDMTYLPGFLAEKFDAEGGDPARTEQCVTAAAKQKARETVKYSDVTETRGKYDVSYTQKRYVMLPVWYLTTNWNGKQWIFAMNAQTGKITGDLPIDHTKLGILSGIGAILAALMFLVMMNSASSMVISALIIGLILFFVGKSIMNPVRNASEARGCIHEEMRVAFSDDRLLRTERSPKTQRPSSGSQ